MSYDGATLRRERILDMLAYARGFMPKGVTTTQIQLFMSINHGLKKQTSLGYIYEMQQGGILTIQNGRILILMDNFKRMIELMAPDRDPESGEKLTGGFDLAINGHEAQERDEAAEKPQKEDKKKKPKPDHGVV